MAVKYRDLIGSDILRKGDQWWCSEFLVWSDTVQVGVRVDSALPYRYRRPIVGRPRKTTCNRPSAKLLCPYCEDILGHYWMHPDIPGRYLCGNQKCGSIWEAK